MGDGQPDLALIPGGETREQQRHAAAMAAIRSRHRWAMARIAGCGLCSAGLIVAGTYVMVAANVLVGMLIALAFAAPTYAMNLQVALLEAQRELGILRRVARRVGSEQVVPDGDGRWHRVAALAPDWDLMTPGEFAAVYGTDDGNEDDD